MNIFMRDISKLLRKEQKRNQQTYEDAMEANFSHE